MRATMGCTSPGSRRWRRSALVASDCAGRRELVNRASAFPDYGLPNRSTTGGAADALARLACPARGRHGGRVCVALVGTCWVEGTVGTLVNKGHDLQCDRTTSLSRPGRGIPSFIYYSGHGTKLVPGSDGLPAFNKPEVPPALGSELNEMLGALRTQPAAHLNEPRLDHRLRAGRALGGLVRPRRQENWYSSTPATRAVSGVQDPEDPDRCPRRPRSLSSADELLDRVMRHPVKEGPPFGPMRSSWEVAREEANRASSTGRRISCSLSLEFGVPSSTSVHDSV